MSDTKYRAELVQAYRGAGVAFLARKLLKVFKKIETEEDRVVHNYMMEDIDILLEKRGSEFLRIMAIDMMNLAGKDIDNAVNEEAPVNR